MRGVVFFLVLCLATEPAFAQSVEPAFAAIVAISEVSTVVRSEVRRGHQADKRNSRRLAQDVFDGLGR